MSGFVQDRRSLTARSTECNRFRVLSSPVLPSGVLAMLEKVGGKAAGAVRIGGLKRPIRQPSIKDIARLAKVSHPTVSRALQNSPLVNAKTAAKIRRIADEAGYRASAVARGLVTRRTRTIGLVVTTVDDPFAGEVALGIEQAANNLGYSVFLANS